MSRPPPFFSQRLTRMYLTMISFSLLFSLSQGLCLPCFKPTSWVAGPGGNLLCVPFSKINHSSKELANERQAFSRLNFANIFLERFDRTIFSWSVFVTNVLERLARTTLLSDLLEQLSLLISCCGQLSWVFNWNNSVERLTPITCFSFQRVGDQLVGR